MANNHTTQAQIVVHGALGALLDLARTSDVGAYSFAAMSAELLYAAPSHLLYTISGYEEKKTGTAPAR
jgi:hypothetical protein